MQTIIDKQRNFLIKKYHIMVGLAGLDNESRLAILSQYGVTSSKDLSVHELLDVCDKLEKIIYPDYGEKDKWRKRLIAAIGAWLRVMGKDQNNIGMIKAVACRAAGGESKEFNAIPLERLRSLYYAFGKKAKDMKAVEMLTSEEIDYLTFTN